MVEKGAVKWRNKGEAAVGKLCRSMWIHRQKTVVWAGGGWGVGKETDQPVLLLYHLGRESWHSIRRHPASLAQDCCLRAQHPPLCTPPLGQEQPGSAQFRQPHSSLQIDHSYKAWGCLQVRTYRGTQMTCFRCTGASACMYSSIDWQVKKEEKSRTIANFFSKLNKITSWWSVLYIKQYKIQKWNGNTHQIF